MIHKKTRTYIPADLEIKWETLEPLYKDLVERS
jgi:oligoendopeptidase F